MKRFNINDYHGNGYVEWDDYGDATVYYFNMGMYGSYNSVSSSHII